MTYDPNHPIFIKSLQLSNIIKEKDTDWYPDEVLLLFDELVHMIANYERPLQYGRQVLCISNRKIRPELLHLARTYRVQRTKTSNPMFDGIIRQDKTVMKSYQEILIEICRRIGLKLYH